MQQNVRIKRLILIEINGLADQKRPLLKVDLDNETAEELSIYRLERLSPGRLTYEVSPMIHYDNELVPALRIVGGWQQPRCLFMMEVEWGNPIGGTITSIIQGYTNKHSEDLERLSDVEFMINSVQIQRPKTSSTEPVFMENAFHFSLLTDRNYSGSYSDDRKMCLREMDAFTSMSSSHLLASQPDLIDTRSILASRPLFANRDSAIPSMWLKRFIEGYSQASADERHSFTPDTGDTYQNARARVQTGTITQHPFFHAVQAAREDGMFRMKDLLQVQPDVLSDAITTYVKKDTVNGIEFVEQEEDSCSESAELPMIAIALGTTAVMSRYGISKARFYAQNDRGDIVLTDIYQSLPESVIEEFKQQIRRVVMPQAGLDDTLFWGFKVDADMFGLTRIEYSDCHGVKHVKTVASFADSLLSPLIFTVDKERLRQDNINTLVAFAETVIDNAV